MRYILFFLGFLLFHFQSVSQTVTVKSYVDKNTVSVNEVITFSISANGNCQVYSPNFGNLSVIQGPFRSSQSRIVDVNGQRTIEQELKYTYRLRAPKEGKFKIAAVKLVCGGKEYSTKAITITVKKGSSTGTGSTTSIPANSSDFFMRMYSSKSTVYLGEPFTVNLKIFSKSQPQNIENLEFGDSKGLLRKDLNPNKSSFNSDIEVINGIRYFTTTIRTELCFAQNSGKIKIAPANISAIFRRGFFNQYREEAKSNALNITVKALPAGAPSNFNGLVGSFSLTHKLSRTVLKPGEAIDMNVKISGNGNLNTFDHPNFEFPNDFEQFDPEIKDKLSYKSNGISGNISYNYVLIPTFYGNYTIPAYTFSYFDITSKSYKTLSTGDIAIEVLKIANSEPGNTNLNQTQKVVEVEKTDIRHNLPYKSKTFNSSDFLITKLWYYLALLLPIIIVWLMLRKRKHKQSEKYKLTTELKTCLATSKQLIEKAKQAAKDGQNAEAVRLTSDAFKTYIKRKNNLSNYDLNKAYLLTNYASKQWSESDISSLASVWDTLEMYQYAPITTDKLENLIYNTDTLINKIASDK